MRSAVDIESAGTAPCEAQAAAGNGGLHIIVASA